MSKRVNIVVFGATGFTGKYTVEEVSRVSKNDQGLTWGIAGRSQAKLEKIIKDLQEKTGDDLTSVKTIIADVSDADSLKEMTKQANVIVNCCGPYRFYGEPVVKACIETNTHYVDVTGEPAFMEKMQLQYNEAAEKAGVYIVSACGYDSIPADMGVVYLEKNFKGQVNSVEVYMKSSLAKEHQKLGGAVIHYGTWESLVYGIAEQKELGPLRRQLFPEKLPSLEPKLQKRSIIHKSEIESGWYLPFPGADKSVIYRSQRFFYDKQKKRPIQALPYIGFASLFGAVCTLFAAAFIGALAMFSCGRKILLKYPRLFSLGLVSHEGPTEEVMKNTKFTMTLYGEGWKEDETDVNGKPISKSMKVKVSGTNPGYGATCTALVFAGLTALKESDKMPGSGGVLTPGAAFANTSLIENLNKNGLTFTVVE